MTMRCVKEGLRRGTIATLVRVPEWPGRTLVRNFVEGFPVFDVLEPTGVFGEVEVRKETIPVKDLRAQGHALRQRLRRMRRQPGEQFL